MKRHDYNFYGEIRQGLYPPVCCTNHQVTTFICMDCKRETVLETNQSDSYGNPLQVRCAGCAQKVLDLIDRQYANK